METRRKFEEKPYADNTDFESEFKEAAIAEVQVSFDGVITGTTGTAAQDGPLKVLGTVELSQNGTRLRADSRLLAYLSWLLEGGVRTLTQTATALAARFSLPFQRMVPGGGLDAVGKAVALRGRFTTGRNLGNNATAPTVTTATRIRPIAVTARVAPAGGFRDPDWIEEAVKIESASVNANNRKVEIRTDSLVPGILLMALDADGDTTLLTDRSFRTDAAVGRVTVEAFGLRDGEASLRLCDDVPWMTLRQETARLFRLAAADFALTAGVVWIPFTERKGGVEGDALFMRAGSHFIVTCDNGGASSFTADQGTPITPAASDVVKMLVPKFFAASRVAPTGAATQSAPRPAARAGRVRNI